MTLFNPVNCCYNHVLTVYGSVAQKLLKSSDIVQFMFPYNYYFSYSISPKRVHVTIRCPHCGGSLYYNYKGYHSVELIALVYYKFCWVIIRAQGGGSEGQIWNDCDLKKIIYHEYYNMYSSYLFYL